MKASGLIKTANLVGGGIFFIRGPKSASSISPSPQFWPTDRFTILVSVSYESRPLNTNMKSYFEEKTGVPLKIMNNGGGGRD